MKRQARFMQLLLVFAIAGLVWALLFGTALAAGCFIVMLACCCMYFGGPRGGTGR